LQSSDTYVGAFSPSLFRGVLRGERPAFFQALWHGVGLGLVLATASLAAWGGKPFLEGSQIAPLIVLTLAAYQVALWANWRMLHFPVRDGAKVIFANVGMAFLLALVIVAFGRYYYSRSFLVTAFVMSLSWQWLGFWLLDRAKLRLTVIPGSMVEELLGLSTAQWSVLAQPVGPVTSAGVVVDRETAGAPEWIRLLADCALRGIPVYDSVLVYEAMTGRIALNHHPENLAEQCATPPLYLAAKQIVDVVLVVASLPITLPFIGLIALLIRLDSAGPAFFWQERVGRAGKTFCMVKFRSMHIDHGQEAPRFAVLEDRRITRLGRWLRRFRLDELPQILNVLRGEMSLIGPRPEQVPFAQQFAREIPLYACRHLVSPGISGWAQVNHGYASGHEETRTKLAYDLYYVKHCSFWLDALIALRTLRTVITGHGAR